MNRGIRVLTPALLAAAFWAAPLSGQINPCAPPNRCLGPNFPALIDTNGDGLPTPGVDTPIVPVYDPIAKTIYADNPWDSCGHARFRMIFSLTDPQPGTGIPTKGTAVDGHGNTIVIAATSFTAANEPKSVSFSQTAPSLAVRGMGSGTLLDQNLDGIFEGGSGTASIGFQVGTLIVPNFVFFDVNGDGIADYVSLPWTPTNLTAMGFNTGDSCGPAGAGGLEPQIFIPLANGRIILDLNGDGIPDPGVFQSPPLAPQGVPPTNTPTPTVTTAVTNTPTPVVAGVVVPTLSHRGMILLALGLLVVAWYALRRNGV
jgi:hypothetical protein